jgi:nucleotide-binding universal stress UspA family protein
MTGEARTTSRRPDRVIDGFAGLTTMWSYPPKRILVPVDFGDPSARAVRLAGFIAGIFGSELTALHAEVYEVPAYFTLDQISALDQQRAEQHDAAESYLGRFVAEHTPVQAKIAVIEGAPTPVIARFMAESDMVVIGTHGRRGPSRWWLGSVAERTVRDAEVPVMVVRAGPEDEDPQRVFRHLLVLEDPSLQSEAAVYAKRMTETLGGQVTTSIPETVCSLPREMGATLVVVAASGGTAVGWLGEPTERILRACTLPTLFVPAVRENAASSEAAVQPA